MRQLLEFESTAKSLYDPLRPDSESPYVMDHDGNVYLEKELKSKGKLMEEDIDEDEYDYEYVIEEEVIYEHYTSPS